jgi:hypothetical protein
MDEFFGLEPQSPEASLSGRLDRMRSLARVDAGGGSLLLRARDPDLPADEALLVKNHGTGRSIYLGGVIWKDGREDRETIRTLASLIENGANTPPSFRYSYENGLGKTGTMVYSYNRGDIRIDAVLPPEATDPEIPVVPVMEWEEKRHTYDLREENYLGEMDRVAIEVKRSSPLVVARLDYEVEGVTVTAPRTVRPGQTLPVTCAVIDTDGTPRPGHVIRVQVFDPDGEECPYYGAWLDGEGPELSWRIPFALNDRPGEWRITATDVISGESGEVRVTNGE